jgi:hypothetical protein
MKCALLIPDGRSVRSFLLGSFLHEVCTRGEVLTLHGLSDGLPNSFDDGLRQRIRWHPLRPYTDRASIVLLRTALIRAHMQVARTRARDYRLTRPALGPWRWRTSIGVARALGDLAASRSGIRLLESVHWATVARLPEVEQYTRLFEKDKPTVLFCANQQLASVLPPVLAARRLGIPTVTFIASWDNITSKGRIAAPFDHYLVWSDLMRKELHHDYPELPKDCVHVVGTPQFDAYADRSLLWSRREFLARVGADSERPLICYSGGDVSTCPDDQHHVKGLLRLVRAGRIVRNPQVLLRPTPSDEGGRFHEVRREFPELIYAPPACIRTMPHDWAGVIPLRDDVQFLANLTHHADLNINMASTMTLDFAIHDRPVVNIGFDATYPPPLGQPMETLYYQWEHYRPVVDLGAARIAGSFENLAEHVNEYLDDPTLDRENRRRFVGLELGVPCGGGARSIIEVLERVSV